jgi:hypothetical protein
MVWCYTKYRDTEIRQEEYMVELAGIFLVQNQAGWNIGKDLDVFLEDTWFVSQSC